MSEENQFAENKLIILYLLEKINIPLSNNEICQFALESNAMAYFVVQKCLSELNDCGFIEAYIENGATQYIITTEGSTTLEFFQNRISEWLKTSATEYILQNNKRIKSEYETSANYFPEITGDYFVKCSVCGIDGTKIMEVDVTVPNKSQAQLICKNWKNDVSSIVGDIFTRLVTESSATENNPCE